MKNKIVKKLKKKWKNFQRLKKNHNHLELKLVEVLLKIQLARHKKKAWELIKEAQCENMKIGDASISEKHSNFFVNQGSATSNDMENLINLVREKVFNTTGIKLELELHIIGEKK